MALADLSRCSIHTMTLKPWSLEQTIAGLQRVGVPGITVWRQHLQPYGPERTGQLLRASGLTVTALCRGGFFPAKERPARETALADNRKAIDEAAAIGAPMVVLVCGAVPGMPLTEARKQIHDGIAALEPYARANRVKLAIEPLHPMYAADRSAINTMAQARAICEAIRSSWVGIAADVYHIWWDPNAEDELARAGAGGWLAGFHVCDWRVETRDLLNDRGLMGEGCIDIPRLRQAAERAGFTGFNEVEIFSTSRWAGDQDAWLDTIVDAYRRHT
jgi:sugar phosphate isomerase/epimerase